MKQPDDRTRSPSQIRRRKPVTIAPGVRFLNAKLMWVRDGTSVLEMVWKLGFDTVFEMRETEAKA